MNVTPAIRFWANERNLNKMCCADAFTCYADFRTRKVYEHNERFAKELKGRHGRDVLATFINHWLDGWLSAGCKPAKGWES